MNKIKFRRQQGATLVELMVGIVIGLIAIGVALGALFVSRNVSGGVSDISVIQQQAAAVFRTISTQIRQAGSIRLNLAAQKAAGTPVDPFDRVGFETLFNKETQTISGIDAPTPGQFELSVGYQNYTESSFTNAAPVSLLRDCLGNQILAAGIIQSQFRLTGTELMCAGSDGVAQPIARNVQDFNVVYLVQQGGDVGTPTIQRTNAAGVAGNWSNVFAVEVCIDLFGDERVDLPAGTQYVNCQGQLTDSTNRHRLVFRNLYQIRSQGTPT